jgi:transcription elongation factor Elf1
MKAKELFNYNCPDCKKQEFVVTLWKTDGVLFEGKFPDFLRFKPIDLEAEVVELYCLTCDKYLIRLVKYEYESPLTVEKLETGVYEYKAECPICNTITVFQYDTKNHRLSEIKSCKHFHAIRPGIAVFHNHIKQVEERL